MKKSLPIVNAVLTIMKITLLQIILSVGVSGMAIASAGLTFGQGILDNVLSINAENKKLGGILEEIEGSAQVKFTFNPKTIPLDQELSVNFQNTTLKEILDSLLQPLSVNYEVSGSYVILRKLAEGEKAGLSAAIRKTYPPVIVVSGTVKDEKDQTLPGASILEKGTLNGVSTDASGKFSIGILDEKSVLVFSFIGYESQEVLVADKTEFTITLQPDVKKLEEVVVVGYGAVKKSDLTGSVSSISEDKIKLTPITSMGQALQGRAAGVQVTQTSFQPGGGVTIRIRGGNSIQGGNEPLYVIDGYPTYNESGPSLNPNDIASIEILKDASATSIYGARGANGVVLITTKRGKAGQSNITFETYQGVQQVRREIPLLNATEFAGLVNEANVNAGKAPVYTDAQVAGFGKGTNWQHEVLRSAPIRNYQLNFSGGSENTRYSISGNYFAQDGIITNSNFNRASFRINLDQKINSKFKIGNNLTLTRTKSNDVLNGVGETTSAGVISSALQFSPILPVYNPDGTYVFQNDRGTIIGNPVATAREITNQTTAVRVLGNVFGEYELTKGLVFRVNLGVNTQMNSTDFYAPRTTLRASAQQGLATITDTRTMEWLNENTVTYTKTIAEKHNLNLLAGYTMQGADSRVVTASAQQFSNDVVQFNDLGSASVANFPTSAVTDWGLASYLARVNYNFSEKYLVTLTTRADGSSRFGAGNKYGFFPSGSVAWRLSEEQFIKNLEVFDDLKLRGSYGVTGNQEIGQYQSLSALGSSGYVFNNKKAVGYQSVRIANPDLRWETTNQLDIGVDMELLRSRVTVTADYYYKKTNDLLLNVTLPWTSGYASALQNLGSVENKGFELAINSYNTVGAFKWNTALNFSLNRNKVLNLGGVNQIFSGQGLAKIVNSGVLQVGTPLNNFFGLVTNGIFQTGDNIAGSAQPNALPGDRRYVDVNGDGAITDADRTILGNAQPKFIGGLTNNFSYKGVELIIFLQGSYGNNIFNANRLWLENVAGSNNNSTAVLNRWTPTNPSNEIPRATASAAGGANFVISRAIENGSYLRAKVITLSYSLQPGVLKTLRLKNAKIYISGQNLFTITHYTGYDPEVSVFGQDNLSMGTDYGTYPSTKTYLMGINIGL
ncbi:MAG TPA: TonB-dependent receptor [Cyclobacteriaceae bacterium]|nr:TonB-dependent receptor [Cyclobacteriaceae bacterium]